MLNIGNMTIREFIGRKIGIFQKSGDEDVIRKKVDNKRETDEDGSDLDVSYLYTPLSVARDELKKRWNDDVLRKKVEDYLGDVPEVFHNGHKAVLFRYVVTPNLECELAQDMAQLTGLDFVFMEFLNDKFCTTNIDKVHLGKLAFFNENNERRSETGSRKKVIDLSLSEGIPFKNLQTLKGDSFVDFHRKLSRLRDDAIPTFDASQFKMNGESAMDVYKKVFSLFVCHGVLFENYFVHTNADERKFTQNVIIPVFNEIQTMFGVQPLIVPIVSNKDESTFWQYYPSDLASKIDTL